MVGLFKPHLKNFMKVCMIFFIWYCVPLAEMHDIAFQIPSVLILANIPCLLNLRLPTIWVFCTSWKKFCQSQRRSGQVSSTDTMNPTLTLTGLERGMRIPSAANSAISTKNEHQLAIHDAWKMFVWQSAFAVQFLNRHKQVQVRHATFFKCNA